MDVKDFCSSQDEGVRLQRTTSVSSTHPLTSAAREQDLKSRPLHNQSSHATSERADISPPPLPSWKTPIQWVQRRPSASAGYFSLGGEVSSAATSALRSHSPVPLRGTLDKAYPASEASTSSGTTSQRNSFSETRGPGLSRLIPPQDHNRPRRTHSSTYSIGSAIMSTSWGSVPSTASSAVVSENGDELQVKSPPPGSGPASNLNPADVPQYTNQAEDKDESLSAITQGVVRPNSDTQPATRQLRNRVSASRRMSGIPTASTTGNASPRSDRDTDPYYGVLGICALDAKARSKPSRNILNKINSNNEFDVVMFGDKIILDEEPENWPLCDYLISFFSEGFPLHKAVEYVKLRKPFSVNDLPMQTVLWDRRTCLRILDRYSVPTPQRIEVIRDGGPRAVTAEIARHIWERTGLKLPVEGDTSVPGDSRPQQVRMKDKNTLVVDGKELSKPFVEKPTSGEDHNIRIYNENGGGRRLFRKINNKSSEADPTLDVPRCITDQESSYIYESFLATVGNEDVKTYTVGPNFTHAETRKSPTVDGIVKRNTHGKEVRYVAELSAEEQSIATRISEAFGQRVCGFDLLRANGKSYVIDVNGWSFVKDNEEYYIKCSEILRDLFVKEKLRKEGRATLLDGENGIDSGLPNRPSGGHLSSLKSILRSPSMSRLAGNHHHTTRFHRGDASPDLSSQTSPMNSPPSFDKASDKRSSHHSPSMPDLPPPITSAPLTNGVDGTLNSAGQQMKSVPPPAAKSQWRMKGMVAVIRHADRTPKQKFKFTFHTKPFVDLLKGHTEEVLLVGDAALNSVKEAVRTGLKDGIEDEAKLKQLQMTLKKKGGMVGTKVQIKPMFKTKVDPSASLEKTISITDNAGMPTDSDGTRPKMPTSSKDRKDSVSGVTLSRVAAAEGNLELEKLQLIIKWGGEPTHSARYQSQELGENFRNDLLLLNRQTLEDLRVYSSSERRVTTSALIWTAAFMNISDTAVPPDYIKIRKDLLDDSNAAKDEMDKVKKKLKGLLRKGNKAPEQFAWPENMPEPYLVARSVVELMQFHRRVMRENYARLKPNPPKAGSAFETLAAAAAKGQGQSTKQAPNQPQKDARAAPVSPGSAPRDRSPGAEGEEKKRKEKDPTEKEVQPRWCSQEDAALFKERWEKLFDEFCDPEKVDPGKISELHDTIKFDALHNRNFLEWIFTPSPATFNEVFPTEGSPKDPVTEDSNNIKPTTRSDSASSTSSNILPTATTTSTTSSQPRASISSASDKTSHATKFAQRMGWRKRNSIIDPATLRFSANDSDVESYFSLYGAGPRGKTRASTDVRLEKLRELFLYSKVLFDFIGPQEYGITDAEKLEIGLLTSLPLLRAIVNDLEDMQASEGAKTRVYFTKESHIYTLLNCIIEGGIQTKINRKKIPELDYLSTICFELYESQNPTSELEPESFNYSIRIAISPGCHTFEPLDVQLDSKHCIGFAQRRSLTKHEDYQQVIETLRAKFHTVKLPKSFTAVNLSEKVPGAFDGVGMGQSGENGSVAGSEAPSEVGSEERQESIGDGSAEEKKDADKEVIADGKRTVERMLIADRVDEELEQQAAADAEAQRTASGHGDAAVP